MRIYLCGPITGIADYNQRGFEVAERVVFAGGHDVVNPCKLDGGKHDAPWEEYLKRDIKLLVDCDAVMLLDEWHHSKGCLLEFHIAVAVGLKFYFWDQYLKGHYPRELGDAIH